MGWAKKMMDYFWLYHLYDKLKYSIFTGKIKLFRSEKKYAIRVHISLHVKLLLLTTMKLKTKLNAIILGFTMILSMQTAFAACKLSFAAQQKKVATISTKKVAGGKKKVAGGKKKIYRKASMRKYSQKELNQIMRTLERKFLSADNSSAWRNIVGFGIGNNSIDVSLRWNTKEKQQEFRNQIYNSSVIKFGDKLDPVIDNKTGVSSYNGISIKAESPSYPLGSTEIKITITNHSGKEFMYGEAYSITAQGRDGNWFILPTDCLFNAIGHILSDGQSATITAHLFPDILPNKPGIYRFFYEENIDGNKVLLMTTFELE